MTSFCNLPIAKVYPKRTYTEQMFYPTLTSRLAALYRVLAKDTTTQPFDTVASTPQFAAFQFPLVVC